MQLVRRGRQRQRARLVRYGVGIMGMLLIKRWAGRLARLLVYSNCSARSREIRIIPER
jgi:hypothetical protein